MVQPEDTSGAPDPENIMVAMLESNNQSLESSENLCDQNVMRIKIESLKKELLEKKQLEERLNRELEEAR